MHRPDTVSYGRSSRRGEQAKRTAAELLHVPYFRRTLAVEVLCMFPCPACAILWELTLISQTKRIKRQEALEEGYTVRMTVQGERRRRTGLLRADLVPLWLTGLSAASVKEEMRDKIKRYQKEAAKVLWEAFQEERLTAESSFEELLEQADNKAVQAYQIALAVVKLARNQILMEKRLTGCLDDHEERLEEIEITLGDPNRWMTPKQASQISQAVKAVGLVYGKKTKRNKFGAVYSELYRKFDITTYTDKF